MPDVRIHLFSMLAVRRVALQAAFLPKHPHAWLVWEPVVWKPSSNPVTSQTLPATFSQRPTTRPDGDALCYELTGERLLVGRAPHCDIRINDAAVSREHLLFLPEGEGWRVAPANPHVATLLEGEPLRGEAGVPLTPRAELRLGGVVLRFEDAHSMAQRLLDAGRSGLG